MATTLTNGAVSAMAAALSTYIGNAGKVIVYAGTAPTDASTALSGNTVLATFTLDSPGFTESNGVLTLDTSPALTVAASAGGTATFFRILKADGTTVALQGSVTATGGGGQLQLNTTTITNGVNVTITSGTVTVPKS